MPAGGRVPSPPEPSCAPPRGTSEYDLLGASRCHGWTRIDVVVHVIAGCEEMLGGLVSPVPDSPTVDAASYWNAFNEQYGGNDPVDVLMSQRRRTAAHARPASALQQLRDVGEALLRGWPRCQTVRTCGRGTCPRPATS
jgi:hypothetical protein